MKIRTTVKWKVFILCAKLFPAHIRDKSEGNNLWNHRNFKQSQKYGIIQPKSD